MVPKGPLANRVHEDLMEHRGHMVTLVLPVSTAHRVHKDLTVHKAYRDLKEQETFLSASIRSKQRSSQTKIQ